MKRKLLVLTVAFNAALTLFSCDKNPHEHLGTFYGFSEAYENGLLTFGDLHVIKDEMATSTVTIDREIATVIKKDYYALLKEKEVDGKTKTPYKDIIITNYYGRYNASYVVVIAQAKAAYPDIGYVECIAGIEFTSGVPLIQVWHQNK